MFVRERERVRAFKEAIERVRESVSRTVKFTQNPVCARKGHTPTGPGLVNPPTPVHAMVRARTSVLHMSSSLSLLQNRVYQPRNVEPFEGSPKSYRARALEFSFSL